jgi:hypothetical protein
MQGQGAFGPGGILRIGTLAVWVVFRDDQLHRRRLNMGGNSTYGFGPCWPRNRADNGTETDGYVP